MKLTVYHGSHRLFEAPDLNKGKSFRDFGAGFYVTEYYKDALNIIGQKPGFVYEYELDTEDLKNLAFSSKEEVSRFIIKNRTEDLMYNYDLISGETLSDCSKLFREVRNKGKQVDLEDIVDLIYKSPYEEQICIKSKKALSKLKLKHIHEYTNEDFY